MFVPYFQKSEKFSVLKILTFTIIFFTILSTIVIISTQAVLTPALAKVFRFPYFVSVQQINLFNFVQRIEFLNVVGWIFVFLLKNIKQEAKTKRTT